MPVGVVLAGGRGRRLGGGKATVPLAGRPLLAYPLAALRAVLDEVAVVAKRDTALPPLPPAVPVWFEPDAPSHPLAGVVEALRRAEGHAVVVAACDLALLDAGLVTRLAEAPAGGAPVVVPRAGGRLQPLCARYEPAALATLEGFRPSVRVTAAVAALAPAVLDVADATPFFNVNAPADLERASALLSRRSRSSCARAGRSRAR
jgi:molybdenum cofactor guanylyltransferase